VEIPSIPSLRGHLYAGFWRRLAAYLIDGLLLGTVQAILTIMVRAIAPDDLRAQLNVVPVSILLAWAYYALMESSPAQATVGKIAVGIYVTDREGDPVDFRRASIRFWAKLISTLTLMIGWLMAAFPPRKRALHDYLAGTLVIRRATVPLLPSPADEAMAMGERWDGSRWSSEPGQLANEPR
jgi:uncharacterized RDD family membrane protein YckC